jgi:hypothetical protein
LKVKLHHFVVVTGPTANQVKSRTWTPENGSAVIA